ncbi:MAG: SHOCT domain-containing protein [Gemmataceae bacterium]|nr:SHOCT domain-containing protein [Gemmataceae bacterium]
MNTLSLLAQAPAKPAASDLLDRPEFIYGTVGLAGALLAGAVVIYLVDRWRKRQATADTADAGVELTSFRAMYERGEITEAEYAKLRQKVASRVKTPPAAGGETAPAPAATDPTTPTPTRPPLTAPLPDDYFDDPPPPPSANGTAGPPKPPA